MRKRIILSSILLLSCLAHADTQNNPQKENPFTKLSQEFQDGSIKNGDITQISDIIKTNIDAAAEACDTITLTFKIKKGKQYNEQMWKEIISLSADLIETCKDTPEKKEDIKEIENILHKTNEFMLACVKFSGDENDIHGDFGISLNTPDHYAQVKYTN